jgi:Domain of unknown function (DUF4279)
VALRIKQYVHFDVFSKQMTAEEMTARIGLEPDQVYVLGARRQHHRLVPVNHIWSVTCAHGGEHVGVGEQIAALVSRLTPVEGALAALVSQLRDREGSDAGCQLSVARWFDARDGDSDGGQHRLLGWHVDEDVIGFLASTKASVDVDEYGQDLPWWRPFSRRRYARS